jgi:hypothetical protein
MAGRALFGVGPVREFVFLALVVDGIAVAQIDEFRDREVSGPWAGARPQVLGDLFREGPEDALHHQPLFDRQVAAVAVGDPAQP